MVAGFGFLFLFSLVVVPSIFPIVGVACGFVFFAVFHYLLWGWWMPHKLANNEKPEKEKPHSHPERP